MCHGRLHGLWYTLARMDIPSNRRAEGGGEMGMSRGVEIKINEAHLHIKPYLDDEETIESLV